MKLLSCHIENFGSICSFDYDFSDGINEFCQPNGTGKSTLAAFLKAMFYGLPAARANSVFNDRMHYLPFNGGKFGGNIEFSAHGKTYRLERFFSDKTEAKDSFTAYVDGVKTTEFDGKSVGEVIFGIDSEAFERTAFITADGAEMQANGAINAKLNKFVYALDGGMDADKAKRVLIDAANKLKKQRGASGEIDRQKEKIVNLKNTIANVERTERNLVERYGERARLSAEIARLEVAENERKRREIELSKWETYDHLLCATDEKKGELAALEGKYPSGLPTQEELAALTAAIGERTQVQARLNALSFTEDKKRRLAELDQIFVCGAPEKAELDALGESVETLREVRGESQRLAAQTDEKYNKLKVRFANKTPTDSELETLRKNLGEYTLAERELVELSDDVPPVQPKKRMGALTAVFGVLGAACLVGGAALATVVLGAAIALIVAGVACAAVCAALAFKGRGETAVSSSGASSARASVKARMNAAEQAIRAILVPYGVYSNNLEYDVKVFEDDLKEYAESSFAEEQRGKKLALLAEQEKELVNRLEQGFAKYGLSGDNFAENLVRLRELIREYALLNGEKVSVAGEKAQLEGRLCALNNQVSGMLEKYGIAESKNVVGDLSRDSLILERLKKEVAECGKKAENYLRENNLTARPAPVEGEDLSAKLNSAYEERTRIDRAIAIDEAEVDELNKYRANLEIEQEKLDELSKRHDVLIAAASALERAEKKINEEYVAPIKNDFMKYAEELEKCVGDKIFMEKDFSLTFESYGEKRSDKHLSSGQRAAWSLCFRLALIDNMYAEEKPFIIMDDPFAELDADGLKNAKRLLLGLAKERQFIYFCCHESRSVKA